MDRIRHSASSPSDSSRALLLVGDIGTAFLDATSAGRYPCDVRTHVLEAIEAAARHDYRAIAVVMASLSGQLSAVLKALRRCTTARVILLAQMYEEPIARALVEAGTSAEAAADEYRLCPTTLAGLCHDRQSDAEANGEGGADGTCLDAALETRIRHLEHLATTDDLTGLKNRRYLWEFGRQVIDRARQSGGRVTLLVFDIDNFKHYNDVYGHPTGDEILRQAAILMQRCCRAHDVVGRIGGDEFAVVFWDEPREPADDVESDRRSSRTDHPKEVICIAKRFQKEFGNAELDLLGPEGQGVLTVSGALAGFPGDGATVQELFERADAALLEAKRSGKNRVYLVGEPTNNIADLS
ncbi:MAG: GGDEF domain-containing protein [Phycisphaerales bacterium]|nr:MAG: GGDEF domain-containing protein [Phycisphaerales bacterium]